MRMSIFIPVIRELEKNNVSYVVVGGLATVLHGHLRFTDDLDIILDLSEENCLKAIKAISSVGYKPKPPVNPEDFANSDIRKSWIEEKGLKVLSFYSNENPLLEVDLFVEHPIDYNSLFKQSVEKEISDELTVRICSIEHLIELKKLSGRPKDLEDVRVLEVILNEK